MNIMNILVCVLGVRLSKTLISFVILLQILHASKMGKGQCNDDLVAYM